MDSNLLDFLDSIKAALGNNLKSFVIYGSAATGELNKKSDYNTLIVTDEIDLADLESISKPVKKWVKKGNPVPLIFTDHSLTASEDVFPLEFLDIKENNLTLYGKNYFRNMKVPQENLRLETERELKGIFLRLLRSYIVSSGSAADMKKVMKDSIPGVLAVFRGVLRLYRVKVPAKKTDVINAMPAALKINRKLFAEILMLRQGRDIIRDAKASFYEYIENIEFAAEKVDKMPRRKKF